MCKVQVVLRGQNLCRKMSQKERGDLLQCEMTSKLFSKWRKWVFTLNEDYKHINNDSLQKDISKIPSKHCSIQLVQFWARKVNHHDIKEQASGFEPIIKLIWWITNGMRNQETVLNNKINLIWICSLMYLQAKQHSFLWLVACEIWRFSVPVWMNILVAARGASVHPEVLP